VRRVGGLLGSLAMELWLPVLLLSLWWFASAGSTDPYFPSLENILRRFADMWLLELWGSDVVPSLRNLLVGYALALVIGMGAGLVLGHVDRLRLAFTPEIEFGRCLPSVALLPLVIVGIGIGNAGKIAIIAFGALWPILLSTIDGVRGTDPILHDLARSIRLGRWRRFRSVLLPSAMPNIVAGAKVSLAISVVLVVVSELAGAERGVGYVLLASQRSFAITDMWAAMVLLGLLGYALNVVFRLVERKVLAWHPSHRAR
jgi:sulfonate transport system permease protein